MSIEAMTWALTVPIGGNQKVLLLGIANHAHPDGSEAYPSLNTLASYAACDRSTARRNVRRLIEDGWVLEDGAGPQGQAKYRLPLGGLQNATGGVASGHEGGLQNATGGVASGHEGGLQNGTGGGGIAVPPEPSINRPSEPSVKTSGAVEELWAHYQATRPHGSRCKLGPAERRLIQNALAVREMADCKLAVTGLFRSSYHTDGGFIGLKYALLGGGRSPDPATTIDRLVHLASNGNGNGNGRAGRLKNAMYDGGRTWDELTPAEQEAAKANAAMDVWPEDLQARREARASVVASSNGHGGLTSENFAADD